VGVEIWTHKIEGPAEQARPVPHDLCCARGDPEIRPVKMSQLSQQLEVVRGFVAIGPVMMSTVREPRQGEAQLMQLHLRPEKSLLKHSHAEMDGRRLRGCVECDQL